MLQRCGGGRTVFLGDSINDPMAAKNAGIRSIAVSFGFLMQPIEEFMADLVSHHDDEQIGIASCRERECTYGSISVVDVAVKKKQEITLEPETDSIKEQQQ